MLLTLIFWILFVLCLIGVFLPPAEASNPRHVWHPRLNTLVLLVMLGILGYKALPHVSL